MEEVELKFHRTSGVSEKLVSLIETSHLGFADNVNFSQLQKFVDENWIVFLAFSMTYQDTLSMVMYFFDLQQRVNVSIILCVNE